MIAIKRPGTGLSPASLPEVLGRRVRHAVARDSILSAGDLEPAGEGDAA